VNALFHFCCTDSDRHWVEVELGESVVGWDDFGPASVLYVWDVLPRDLREFSALREAFFGDTVPTPFGTPRTVPMPAARPTVTP
jgi:hypothetical protein